MGSGSRFEWAFLLNGPLIGFRVSRFPFAVTVELFLLFVYVSIGFGKGYDE